MRLVLTMLSLICLAIPSLAQSDDFNPYQAVLDAMPLEQARPLLEAAYGPIEDVTDTFGEGWATHGEKLLGAGTGSDRASTFLFCGDRLAAAYTYATPATAAEILRSLSRPGGPELVLNPHAGGIAISAAKPDVAVTYRGVGTRSSYVSLSYPSEVFVHMNFKRRCEEVAAD